MLFIDSRPIESDTDSKRNVHNNIVASRRWTGRRDRFFLARIADPSN